MTASTSTVQAASSDHAQSEVSTRLHGSHLLIARIIWAVLVLFALGLLAFNLPHLPQLLAQFQAPCQDA